MTHTALTYGTSLFDLAVEENQLQAYMQELSAIRQAVKENPQLLELLDCRAVPKDERLDVLDACFKGQVQDYLLSFMKILCEKGAIRLLPDCIRQFELRYFDACGIVEARATTARELSPVLKEKLTKKLESMTGKTVMLQCAVDASVLGGVRLELMGRQMDGTVKRRLVEVGKSLTDLTL